jgi:hypothetical protein
MAAFATFAAAEIRAYAKRADGTWINAFAEATSSGVFAVRVQRKMNAAALATPNTGSWVSITDDAGV